MVLVLIIIIVILGFVVYAYTWSAREGQKFNIIHAAALKALATDKPADVPGGTTAAAAGFFEVYGTTEKKYEEIMTPFVAYAGYVRLENTEVIAIAFKHARGLTVVIHDIPIQLGNDLSSLVKKMQYMKGMLQAYKGNSKG